MRNPLRTKAFRYASRVWCVVAFVLVVAPLSVVGCGSEATGSIGAILSRDSVTGAVHVRRTPEGLAAKQAGMIPGDRIKMIDGVLVDRLDVAELKRRLRGAVGSKVELTVLRGEQVLQLELARTPLRSAGSLPARHETIDSATER